AKYGAERVRTVGGAWLGATLGCCECHDHKFDPFTARDFYSMQAFFADVKQWGLYASYSYTPNPEVTGCGNEPPFPTEAEADDATFRIRAPAGWVSALRVRLLPHESHQDSIVRGGVSNSMMLKLSATVRRQEATQDTSLAFRHADADAKEPVYKDGEEVIGVKSGWKTAAKYSRRTQTAVWL